MYIHSHTYFAQKVTEHGNPGPSSMRNQCSSTSIAMTNSVAAEQMRRTGLLAAISKECRKRQIRATKANVAHVSTALTTPIDTAATSRISSPLSYCWISSLCCIRCLKITPPPWTSCPLLASSTWSAVSNTPTPPPQLRECRHYQTTRLCPRRKGNGTIQLQ